MNRPAMFTEGEYGLFLCNGYFNSFTLAYAIKKYGRKLVDEFLFSNRAYILDEERDG